MTRGIPISFLLLAGILTIMTGVSAQYLDGNLWEPPASFDLHVNGSEVPYDGPIDSVSPHPTEGWILLGLRSGHFVNWDGDDGFTILPHHFPGFILSAVDWHPSGDYVIIGGGQGELYRYTPLSGEDPVRIETGASDRTREIEFSPDGSKAMGVGFYGHVIIYEHATGTAHTDLPAGEEAYLFFMSVAWHPSGNYALVVGTGVNFVADLKMFRWQEGTWTVVHRSSGWDWMWDIEFHPDGDYALIGGCLLKQTFMGCRAARVWSYEPLKPIGAVPIYVGEEDVAVHISNVEFDDSGTGWALRQQIMGGDKRGILLRTTNGVTVSEMGTPIPSHNVQELGHVGNTLIIPDFQGRIFELRDGSVQTVRRIYHRTPDIYIDWPEDFRKGENITLKAWVMDPEGLAGGVGVWNITTVDNWTHLPLDENGTVRWEVDREGAVAFNFTGRDAMGGFTYIEGVMIPENGNDTIGYILFIIRIGIIGFLVGIVTRVWMRQRRGIPSLS